jgi:hypothetical protein
MDDDSLPPPMMLDILREQLDALGRFVAAYADVDPLDTSPEERRRLAEVRDLLNQALDRFT